jgi:hypothetical protein
MTSSRSEVENRIARPWAASLRMVRNTSALAPTSMPRLGSSISRTFGLVISALPITTFCWLPPDIEVTSKSGFGALIDRSRIISLIPCFSAPALMWKIRVKRSRLASVRLLAIDSTCTSPRAAGPRDQGKPRLDPAGGVARRTSWPSMKILPVECRGGR